MKHTEEMKQRLSEIAKARPFDAEGHARSIASRLANGGTAPHGTTARYKGTTGRPGCRCDKCKTAWRDYKRAVRAKQRLAHQA